MGIGDIVDAYRNGKREFELRKDNMIKGLCYFFPKEAKRQIKENEEELKNIPRPQGALETLAYKVGNGFDKNYISGRIL